MNKKLERLSKAERQKFIAFSRMRIARLLMIISFILGAVSFILGVVINKNPVLMLIGAVLLTLFAVFLIAYMILQSEWNKLLREAYKKSKKKNKN